MPAATNKRSATAYCSSLSSSSGMRILPEATSAPSRVPPSGVSSYADRWSGRSCSTAASTSSQREVVTPGMAKMRSQETLAKPALRARPKTSTASPAVVGALEERQSSAIQALETETEAVDTGLQPRLHLLGLG